MSYVAILEQGLKEPKHKPQGQRAPNTVLPSRLAQAGRGLISASALPMSSSGVVVVSSTSRMQLLLNSNNRLEFRLELTSYQHQQRRLAFCCRRLAPKGKVVDHGICSACDYFISVHGLCWGQEGQHYVSLSTLMATDNHCESDIILSIIFHHFYAHTAVTRMIKLS